MDKYEDWDEEKCIALIREYRARPVLWDSQDPDFYKKPNKLFAWEEIAKIVNIPVNACRYKLSILLSSFMKERSKTVISIKEGKRVIYNSNWFGFKEFAFLMDKDSERKYRVNSQEEYIEADSDSSTSNPKRPRIDLPPLVKLRPNIQQQQPSGSQAVCPGVHYQETMDEIQAFSNFIASKMRKYSEATKNAVQREICDIIFKADRNRYESDHYTVMITDKESDLLLEDNTKIKEENDVQVD